MSGDGYALGQPVHVTGFVTRARLGNRRWWARTAITDPERQSGIVVGRRTLSDGTVDQEYDTDFFGMRVVDTVYRAEAYFPGWLVVRDMREKPIMVLDEDLSTPGNHRLPDPASHVRRSASGRDQGVSPGASEGPGVGSINCAAREGHTPRR